MVRSFLRRWMNLVSRPLPRGPHARRTGAPRCRPQVHVLEDRWLPSTILWNGNGDDGLWRTAANWVGGSVPGSADDAVIDDTSPPVTVTVSAGSPVSVRSLTDTKPFVIGASFTVTAGTSSVSGPFTVRPQAILAAAGSFTATGTTTIDGANLLAAGGTLSLPGATTYNAQGNEFSSTLRAVGSGSQLNLPHVTAWIGAGDDYVNSAVNVQAFDSGVVNLPRVTTISEGNSVFQALDGGQINLNALTSGGLTLEARRGGATISAPNLSSLSSVNLVLQGNASLAVPNLTSFAGSVSVSSDGTVGGMLTLPVTTFTGALQASGPNSQVNLPNVTTWRGNVQALSGATVNLPQLAQINAGNSLFQAADGGQINLNALTSFSGATHGANALDARRGGATITAPNLSSLSNVNLVLQGNASLPGANLTSFVHGDISVSNDGTAGGVLSLPLLTTIDELNFNQTVRLRADGPNSLLDLSSVTTWRGAGNAGDGHNIIVQALNGATVNLPQVTTISEGNSVFQALDGSRINLTGLTSFSGATSGGVNALSALHGGATISATNLSSLSNVTLGLQGNASLPVANLTSFAHGDLSVSSDSTAGGVLSLPLLTTIDELNFNDRPLFFSASGPNSLLDLSSVTTWRGAGSASNPQRIDVVTFSGGVVDLSHLAQINEGNTVFSPEGGRINLTGLTSLTGGNVLRARAGGTLTLTTGTLTFTNGGGVGVEPNGVITVGTLVLGSGSLLSAGTGLGGSSTITGNVVNGGAVDVHFSRDTLVITGTYTQTGNLTGGGTLTVNGLLTWAGGSIGPGELASGTRGTVNANGGLSISGDTTKTLDARPLNDNGSGTWTGLGNLNMGNGAALNLLGSATLDIQNDQVIANTLGGTATLTNAGLLRKSAGTGTTSMQLAFSNAGTVQVQSGTISLTGNFTNTGNLTLGPGSLFRVTGNYSQGPSGTLEVQLGDVPASGQFGQLVVTGQATLDGTLQIDLVNGYMPNPGDTFTIVTFGSRSGDFTTLNLSGGTWDPDNGTVSF
jgi:hypothetical protein